MKSRNCSKFILQFFYLPDGTRIYNHSRMWKFFTYASFHW